MSLAIRADIMEIRFSANLSRQSNSQCYFFHLRGQNCHFYKNEMFVTGCFTGWEEYTEEASQISLMRGEHIDGSLGSSIHRPHGTRGKIEMDGDSKEMDGDSKIPAISTPDALIPQCSSVVQKDGTVRPLSSADPSQIESVKNKWHSWDNV
ncbi:conserved hypothetical protein [Histoplasma capsulatum var. duboisii H88]|uniref:Uncharacterized protein n=2 Tax=Ajellomyces capsulatus TaxID=5037 RepID=F0UQA4_AJEC8|nr:conserved hypothetical protein [Histoplasma capsulatum H143]EGC47102.1 conserved hypothetical protein [Histoplasma capsulatum var. duboisii H88]